jgi:acyl-CoA synthetase (AMP-forming)/AMP-acid ligase II
MTSASIKITGPRFEAASLVQMLQLRALQEPERRAYTFLVDGQTEGDSLTFGELDRRARAIATRLQALGVNKGRALLIYQAGIEYVEAFFGCLYAEAIAVPIPPVNFAQPKRGLTKLGAIAEDSRPSIALTTSHNLNKIESLFFQSPELRAIRWLATDTIVDGAEGEWMDPSLDRKSLAYLQYTSGSTSAPRGVMISHGNVLSNLQVLDAGGQYMEKGIVVSWLPHFHDMGLVYGIIYAVYKGIPAVLMPPTAFIQRPIRWLEAISRYRGTHSAAPNFAYDLCVSRIPPEARVGLDLSSWRGAMNGAEPVRKDTIERFLRAFGPLGFRRSAFCPGYGLAEATLKVSASVETEDPVFHVVSSAGLERHQVLTRTEDHSDARVIVGCGRPIAEAKVVIVDPETLIQSPAGRVGEIWTCGSSVSAGYWNNPEETSRTFRAYLAGSGEGPFLRTGDLGFIEGGELFVTGRLKDLMIIAGRNHYPQDIEMTIQKSHTAFRPSCCAAFSVDIDGEEKVVVIVEVERRYKPTLAGQLAEVDDRVINTGASEPRAAREPGDASSMQVELDAEVLIKAARQGLDEYHYLRAHEIILVKAGSIPKTSSGKIQRHLCRSEFLAQSLTRWN